MINREKTERIVDSILDLWNAGEKFKAVTQLRLLRNSIPEITYNFLHQKMVDPAKGNMTDWIRKAFEYLGGDMVETNTGKIYYEANKPKKRQVGDGHSDRRSTLF